MYLLFSNDLDEELGCHLTLFISSNTGYLAVRNVRLSEIIWIWDKSRTVFHLTQYILSLEFDLFTSFQKL